MAIETYSLQAGGVILSARLLEYCSSRDKISKWWQGHDPWVQH